MVSRGGPQGLSSIGIALLYTHSYPQGWIGLSALFDRSIRAGTAGPTGHKPTTRASRPANHGARTLARHFAASQGRSLVDCFGGHAYTVSVQRPEGRIAR